jgi:hypothetical protein
VRGYGNGIDTATGDRVVQYGIDIAVIVDKELVNHRLPAAAAGSMSSSRTRRRMRPRMAEARRGQSFRVLSYLLANVGPRFHTDSDLPPEAGDGLLTLS